MSFVEGNLQLGIELAPGTLDRLKSQIAQMEKGVTARVNIDSRPIQNAATSVNQLQQASLGAANAINRNLGGALRGVSTAVGAMSTAAVGGMALLINRAVQAGKEFNVLQQQVRAGLKAILGTTSAAEGLLAQVNQLNDTSPFPRSAFLAATQQLVGFGVEAGKVVPVLNAIQNAVAGIGGDQNDIAMFTRAFAQIQSQGRLTGDVLFSLGSKGIDAAAIIGQQMGKSGQAIKDEVSKGAIGAEQAIDLLTKGLTEKFAGAVENVSQSFAGASDRVTARLRDIGARLTSVFITPTGGGAAVVGLNNIADGLKAIRDNFIPQLMPAMQSLADLFVTATEKFRDFAQGLNAESIQKFLDIIKGMIPVVGFFATNFTKSILETLPVLQRFAPALSGPVVAIGLLVASVPELRDQLMGLVEAFTPLVQALIPAFEDVITSSQGILIAIAPIVAALVQSLRALAAVVTPMVQALQSMGLLGPILSLLAIRFLAVRLAGVKAFVDIGNGARTAALAVRTNMAAAALTINMLGTARAAGTLAMGAVRGIGTALASLASPATVATGAIIVLGNMLADAEAKAQKLAASVREGLNIEVPEELEAGLTRVNRLLEENAAAHTSQSLMGRAFSWLPFVNNTALDAKKALEDLREERDALLGAKAIRDNIISDVVAATGKTSEEVKDKVSELNLTLTEIPGDRVGATVKKITDAFEETPAAVADATAKIFDAMRTQIDVIEKASQALDKLKASQRALADLQKVTAQELNDNVTRAQLNLESAQLRAAGAADRERQAQISLAQAQRNLTAASEGVIKAQERLAELEKERARLLADVNAEARELAEAEANLARTRQELVDIGQREQELLREQEDLAAESGDKIAAADRSIERARIAKNNATREEIELQRELSGANDLTLNLEGLSVDQIKSRLSGARAQLAAQRSVNKHKKTEEQIQDELKTAELNRLDAEQAYKDAIEARGDVEQDLAIAARENAEALQAVQLDREAALRREETLVRDIGYLREGDTTTARTLKTLNDEIATATQGIVTANENVELAQIDVNTQQTNVKQAVIDTKTEVITLRDAQREVRDATDEIRKHAEKIRDAQKTIKDDAQTYKEAVATAKGDNESINRLLLDRIGLNSTLLQQNPDIARKLAEQIIGQIPVIAGPGLSGKPVQQERMEQILNFILNNPAGLMGYLKSLGFEKGGIVTQHTFAQIGEKGKAEVVLPLTNPGRSMTLLAQSIPLMHTALQKKIAPMFAPQTKSIPSPTSSSLSPWRIPAVNRGSGNPIISKKDGPATYGQIQELINLMKDYKGEVHVEAPITVVATGTDEELLIKKISRRLERQIYDILSKRR